MTMDACKLSKLSFDEINSIRKRVEDDGQIDDPNSFWKYDHKARKKLDQINWAIAYKLQDKRRLII